MYAITRLVLAAAMLVVSTAAQAQQEAAISAFGLRPSASSRNAVYCGDSKGTIVRVLGTPTKTSRYYYEIQDAWATILHYGPNKLFFLNDRLDTVELHDSRWIVGRPGVPGIQVGSVLPKGSAAARPGTRHFLVEAKPGMSRGVPYSAVSYGPLKDAKGHFWDEGGYDILLDKKGKITHIFIGSS